MLTHITDVVESLEGVKSVFDGFAGTTRVGQCLRAKGYKVISNDSAHYSFVFSKCYLKSSEKDLLLATDLLEGLNEKCGELEGFITTHYAGGAISKGVVNPIMYWQRKNTLKADWFREEIEQYKGKQLYYILLTSLIMALDKVDNTVGVQQAFLKNTWSKRSYNEIYFEPPKIPVGPKGRALRGDTNKVILKVKADLCYYDPPYTSHNYGSYYHIWDTIVLNDCPMVSGIVNRREGIITSDYNKKNVALSSFTDLLSKTASKYILISYNDEGLIKPEDLLFMCEQCGNTTVIEIDYKRNIMSQIGIHDMSGEVVGTPGKKMNKEYLFLVIST